jgi:hypothetical protein
MRLYRGIKEPFRAEKVASGLNGTDFTDCPWTALRYANARRGELLVVDLPEEKNGVRLHEALWAYQGARRFQILGKFDQYISAALPAKELRKVVRAKGIVTLPDGDKSRILKDAIMGRQWR